MSKIHSMKKVICLFSVLVFLSACDKSAPNIEIEVLSNEVTVSETNEFVCGRDKVKDADGNEYKTAYFDVDGGHDVDKEGQCWMAENLNVGTKILDPGEMPSDDEVIEKWCMTDDWSAEFLQECDTELITPRPEVCQERYKRRHNDKQKSSIDYCNGIEGKNKDGGLYLWQEAMSYDVSRDQGICPEGWVIPRKEDWEILKKNLDEGLGISIAQKLKDEKFNGDRVGTFIIGQDKNYFSDREQIVHYLSLPEKIKNSETIMELRYRTLFSHGDNKDIFEGPLGGGGPNIKKMNELGRMTFSIRCKMK